MKIVKQKTELTKKGKFWNYIELPQSIWQLKEKNINVLLQVSNATSRR